MASSSHVTNTSAWRVNEIEVGYNLEKTAKTAGLTEEKTWKVFIPKILPLIMLDIPKDTPESLSASVFINAKDCKPTVQPMIKTRNYVMVTRPANRSFTYKYKTHGMELEVDVLHGNLDNLRISNNVDKSTPKAK